MYVDSHFHIDSLLEIPADVLSLVVGNSVIGIASCHSRKAFDLSDRLRKALDDYYERGRAGTLSWREILGHRERPHVLLSFGIHPQEPDISLLPLLRELASEGSIQAIGECGFDFWEDRPSCMPTEAALKTQTEVFEAQLETAIEFSVPIILHMRKARQFLFTYAKPLAKLPAVILHSWNGPANEAIDFLRHVPNAYFSFGTGLLNGNKKAFATAGILPPNRILTESDAPWQAPRIEPVPGARLYREYSSPEDLPRIVSFIARARILHGMFLPGFWDEAVDPSVIAETEKIIENNFYEVFRA